MPNEPLPLNNSVQGIRRQESNFIGDAPWDLQDVLLSEQPVFKRRPNWNFVQDETDNDLSLPSGRNVLFAYQRVMGSGRGIYFVESDQPGGNTRIRVLYPDGSLETVRTIGYVAQYATICDGYSSKGDLDDATYKGRENVTFVTSDVGTYAIQHDPGINATPEVHVIAEKGFAGTKEISGGGFRYCATVGPFTFIARRDGAASDKAANWVFQSQKLNSKHFVEDPTATNLDLGSFMNIPHGRGGVSALGGMSNSLYVFKSNCIVEVQVSADANALWPTSQVSGVGTEHHRSIAYYQQSMIFASREGVYRYSGYDTINLTEEAIGDWYREMMLNSDDEWSVTGFVHDEYYALCIIDNTGTYVGTFIYHFPTQAWSQWTNTPFTAHATGIGEGDATIAFHRSGPVMHIGRCFDRWRNSGADGTGNGPKLKVEFRRVSPNGLEHKKTWRRLVLWYKAIADTGDPHLRVSYTIDLDETPTWTLLGTLPDANPEDRKRFNYVARAHALGIKIEEDGSAADTYSDVAIKSIEPYYRTMRHGRTS